MVELLRYDVSQQKAFSGQCYHTLLSLDPLANLEGSQCLSIEKVQSSSSSIFSKASEEASTWTNIKLLSQETSPSVASNTLPGTQWVKPPAGILKCNVASSWVDPTQNSGAAWIARDSVGLPLFHSRCAFSPKISSLEAELHTLWLAVEALHDIHVKRVIFEVSFYTNLEALFSPMTYPQLSQGISRILRSLNSSDLCQVIIVPVDANSIDVQVASSVTRDRRYHSYMAKGTQNWLSSSSITDEARNAGSSYLAPTVT